VGRGGFLPEQAPWQEIVSEKDKEIAQLRKQVDWFKGQFK
jgi:hypothetical protein